MSDEPEYVTTEWGVVMIYQGKRYKKDPAGFHNPYPLGGWVEITDLSDHPSPEVDDKIEEQYRQEAKRELDRDYPADLT